MPFNFEENANVTDINTVPENYRGLYEEGQNDAGDTVFKVSGAAQGLVADYIGTNKSLVQSRADKKAASDESAGRRVTQKSVVDFARNLGIDEFDENEPLTALTGFITDLTEQVKGGKQIKVDLDKIKAESKRLLDEAVSVEIAKTGKMQSSLERYLVGEAAGAAISDAKGSRELLLPIVKEHVRVVQDGEDFVVRVVDSDGDVRSDGAGGWMGIAALVAEMKTNDRYARAFESEAPAGSGTKPGSMSQKTARKTEDLTPAQKIAQGITKGQHSGGRAAA